MESIPSDSAQFFEDMKVAMETDLGKQIFAYYLNAFPNSAQYILGPFFSAYSEEVTRVWVTQPRNSPIYFSDFTWATVWESTKPFKGWPTGTPLKPDPTATKEAPSKKASSAAGKPDHSSSADGSPRPAEHPSPSHSIGAVQSATTFSAALEAQPSAPETEIGAQVMTPVVEDESAEVNTNGHTEGASMGSHETTPMPDDHAREHVAELTEEDFPHVPNSQRATFGPDLSSADTTAVEANFQPLFAMRSDPLLTRPLEAPRSGPTFQADVVESTTIPVDSTIVTSSAPSTTPTDGSAPLEPILMLTSEAPALVVDIIPPELPLEVGESSTLIPAETITSPPAEDGRSLAMVPHEDAPLPFPDQPSGNIFNFLDQWDASISSAEASTRLATSSTTTGALPDYGAEALLRSYRDSDLVSLEDKDERAKLKGAIETLASSGFFPDPRSAAMITYLFGQVEKFAPRRRSLLEEQRLGQTLEQRITSCSATMRKEVEIVRQMQQETADIDEQMRQLQERKAAIAARVSEIARSNGPLEAQLRQDATAAGAYRERKLTVQSTLSVGDTAIESFRTALRTLFPDA
ncbi:hypothetical protein ACE6H2_017400 [Prunus campanulata]